MSSFPAVFWETYRGEHRNSYTVDSSDDTICRYRFGQRLIYRDGRTFVFAGNDGTADLPGNLYQAPAPGANYDELVTAAAAVGASSITPTNGATAITANQFKGGYLNVEDDAGEGYAYRIESHAADAGSGAVAFTLDADDKVVVALTAASTTGLTEDPFNNVIIHPSPPTTTLVGFAQSAVPANKGGWYLRNGMTSALTEGTLVAGGMAAASGTTDGAVAPLDATNATTLGRPLVGVAREIAATTEYSPLMADLGW